MNNVSNQELTRLVSVIDYSEALTITGSEKDVKGECETAKRYGFRAVVAFPQYLWLLVEHLEGSGVQGHRESGDRGKADSSPTRRRCLREESASSF